MCTLIIARDMFDDYPLVVASNRDENPNKPSAGPDFYNDGSGIYAPKDLVHGGTWIGMAVHHVLFAAVTNRVIIPHVRGRASRGQIVRTALSFKHADEAARSIAGMSGTYNGFHLVVADEQETWVVWNDGICHGVLRLGPGLHIVTSHGFGPTHALRAVEIEKRFAAIREPSPEQFDTLLNFHADHDPKHAACVHMRSETHRTCSSMLIRANGTWSKFETWYRLGPACSGPFGAMVTVPITQQEVKS